MTGKNLFDTTVTVEHIQDVPSTRGYLFAKLKMKNGKFRSQTATKKIVNHKVDWHDSFQLQCSIKSENGRLVDKYLRISVKKETNGGKDSEKLGSFDINLAERASFNAPCQGRYLLKVNKKSKTSAGNSIVVVTTSMVRVMGDPIFKTVADSQIKTLGVTTTQLGNTVDIVVPNNEASDSEGGSVSSGSNGMVKSPSHSLDCVSNNTTNTPPEPEDPSYTTMSLDRRYRTKPRTIIQSLRTKSYSGSSSSMVDALKPPSSNGTASESTDGSVKKHHPQSRQDSGLGGSNDEHINYKTM